jgi:hypothetical protein
MFARGIRFVMVLTLVVALSAALLPAGSPVKAQADMMNYGDSVTGEISNSSYYEVWQFSGTRGDRVRITMTGTGGLDSYLGLLEATSEEVVAEDDDSAGNTNAMIDITLPTTDTYVIVASRYGFDTGPSAGSYTLTLQSGASPNNTTTTISQETTQPTEPQMLEEGIYYMGDLVMNENTAGEITTDSYAQIYSLQVDQATDLAVVMLADSSNLDPYIVVMDADGNSLAEDDDSAADFGGGQWDSFVTIPITTPGEYLIVATRAGLDAGTSVGAYVITAGVPEEEPTQPENPASDLPAGFADGGTITVDTPMTGAIDNATYIQMYTFEGTADEMITITMVGDNTLDAYVGILDASDNVIAEDDDSGGGANGLDAQIAIRLPESGIYTIVATRAGLDTGTSTGNYTLTVSSGSPAASTSASGLSGFGGLPGRAFPVGDSTFYLRGFGASNMAEKATPLQNLVNPPSALPSRSFNMGVESFALTGFGASSDPAKNTPLENALSQ